MARREPHEFIDSFGALARCIRAVASDAYAKLEVGTAQAKFLRHIGGHSRISQADLARATATAPTLTGRALETLIERGWVRRKRSLEDRREYVLELTPAGRRTRKRVEEARNGIIAQIGTVLDEKDLADFERITNKVLAAFEDAGDEGPNP